MNKQPDSRIAARAQACTSCRHLMGGGATFLSVCIAHQTRAQVSVGMNFLRQFAAVTIDHRQKSIRFELTEAPPLPSPGVRINSHV